MERRDFFRLAALGATGAALPLPSPALARVAPDAQAFQPARAAAHQYVHLDRSGTVIAGYPLSWWEKNYGVPLHVHHGPTLQANVKAFRAVFAARYPRAEIRFAAKANPHPSVFRLVVEAGEGIDVASEFEADGALRAGADPRHMDANGNAKSEAFLRLAIDRDMLIVSDSAEEFQKIAALAAAMNRRPRVVQRLSGFSLGNVTQASSFTAGSWTKFGLNIRDFAAFLALLDRTPGLDFQGFHVHIGSPIATLDPYRIVAGRMVEFSRALAQRGRPCRILNMGGGYPVNYLDGPQWTAMLDRIRRGYEAANAGDPSKLWVWENAAAGFQNELTGKVDLSTWTGEQFHSAYPKERMVDALLAGDVPVDGKQVPFVQALRDLGEPTLVIEPGRSIVEDCGVSLSRVSLTKKVDGIHDLIALELGVVNLGDALDWTIPMNRWALASGGAADAAPFEAFVAGHLCFTGDMPSRYKIALPRKPVPGDILMTRDTGAYSPQFYAANTNAFPRPARVLVLADGSIEFLKTRDTLEEIYSLPR